MQVFIIGRIILYIVCQTFRTAPVYKHYLDFTLLLHAYILLMHCAQCIYIHDILYTLFIFIVDICISVHMYVCMFFLCCIASLWFAKALFSSCSLSSRVYLFQWASAVPFCDTSPAWPRGSQHLVKSQVLYKHHTVLFCTTLYDIVLYFTIIYDIELHSQ